MHSCDSDSIPENKVLCNFEGCTKKIRVVVDWTSTQKNVI
jgi:hypothetical protein